LRIENTHPRRLKPSLIAAGRRGLLGGQSAPSAVPSATHAVADLHEPTFALTRNRVARLAAA
jgi:hypothetical protein